MLFQHLTNRVYKSTMSEVKRSSCVCRSVHSMLAACTTSPLHASRGWLQLLSDPHTTVSAVCVHLQTYSHIMFNTHTHTLTTLLAAAPTSARREQTFKNPSQDVGFVIFPGASWLITSDIRRHLWLLLCLSSSCVEHLKESCSHKHGCPHALLRTVEAQPGSALREVLILALASLDLSANK